MPDRRPRHMEPSDQPNRHEETPPPDELARVLKSILEELREINTSLKSIARSQAHQATMQKAAIAKRTESR